MDMRTFHVKMIKNSNQEFLKLTKAMVEKKKQKYLIKSIYGQAF